MKFLPPIFELHDRSKVELFVYSINRQSDMCTDAIRPLIENFVMFHGMAWDLAERVRADRIDILVDLAGHTMPWEYFQVFAMKPAPVQATWLGMLSTTGMPGIDYFIGGPEMPCPGTEHLYTERVIRLPRAPYCYRPGAEPPVAPSPCLERGYVTFGSFNSPAKLNREVVRVWSGVLHAVPSSRLLLKYRTFDTDVIQQRFTKWFAEDGVGADRLQFEGLSKLTEYLDSYARIDVALDPFPYQGGSTTLDTLWMGVPMIAMAGRLAVGRSASRILGAAGLGDTVVDSTERYVEAAVFLAGIVDKIPDLRHNVREAFRRSAFMDEVGVTRELEAAYREMWRNWCAGTVAHSHADC
jgi:predicted O-linked N-acetylglucosamine transferase (SPINDLY family)